MAIQQLLEIVLHQGAWPFFERYSPSMYPFVLVAFVLALFLILREIMTDAYYILRGERNLLRSLRIDVVWIGQDVIAISLFWLAFATPFDRLPWPPPPAVSGWYIAYVDTAVLLHGALALFPIQYLFGAWLARFEFSSQLSQRLANLAEIVCAAVVVYGWEVQHWLGGFTVPAELYFAISVSFNLARFLVGEFSTNTSRLRLQHLGVMVLLVAGMIAVWLYHGIGLPANIDGLIRSHDAPMLYPFALVALAISVLLTLFNFVRLPSGVSLNPRATQVVLAQTLILFILQFLAVYLVWLAFTTPIASLPFAAPAAGSRWLFIPLDVTYMVTAVLLHAVISLFGVSNLLSSWASILFHLRARQLASTAVAFAGFAVAVIGWEVQHWPLWLIIPVELLLAYLLAETLSDALDDTLDWLKARSPQAIRRVLRAEEMGKSIILLAAILFITFRHNVSFYILNLLGLYFAVVTLEKILALGWSMRQAHRLDYQFDNPRRWRLTVMLIPLLALLGASGVFAPLITNPGIDLHLWIEVGAAGTAYVLFKPLIDLARYQVQELAEHPEPSRNVADLVEKYLPVLGQILAQMAPRGEIGAGGQTPTAAATPPVFVGSGPFARPGAALQESTSTISPAELSRRLNLHVGPLFLLTALVYHFLIGTLHISSILNGAFLPLVFGLTALVAGLLPLLEERMLSPTRYTSLLLMFVTLIVTGITVLFTFSPQRSIPAIDINSTFPLSLLTDQRLLASVGAVGFQDLLFLLTVGQLGYLYIVVEATISLGIKDPTKREQSEHDEDLADFAEWLMGEGRQGEAMDYYRQALAINKNNAHTWRRMGLDQQHLGRYDAALSAYEQACAIAPNKAMYWNDKGVALAFLDRYDDAIVAFEQALALDPNYDLAADNLGDALSVQGHFEQAVETYRRATVLVARNPIYWDDLGGGLTNLRRYEEALRAFNMAVKLDRGRALTLRNKAELLLKGLKRYDEALSDIKRALRLDGTSVRAWAICGLAHQALGHTKEAQIAFDRVLSLDPEPTGTWASRADVSVAMGRYAEALKDYDRALRDYPYDPDVWQGKAAALRALGRETEARQAEGHIGVSSSTNFP